MEKDIKDKIIFLDIDGVLCVFPEWQNSWVDNEKNLFSEPLIKNLKTILDATGAKIVISSSWRLHKKSLLYLYNQLEKCGILRSYIVGQTDDLSKHIRFSFYTELRWLEIKDYIDKNKIEKYIIIDDYDLEKYDKLHLVRTKRYMGLTAVLTNVCIKKLVG